jgi:Clp amino terminal domain, pathogenicity island component
MARDKEPGGPYLEAIQRAFQFARAQGRACDPADFLVGLAAGPGAAAAALDPGTGLSLADIAAVSGGPSHERGGYLHMQAQEAATSLAAARDQPVAPEHLLIALLDQGTPEVTGLLSRAGLDPAAVRRAALAAIGGPADLPPIPLPALTPAGTLDRPPLPVADLDARAWAVLRWRQDHLPLARLRRAGDLRALIHLERAAAWRVADRLGLDDDQRHSLVWQHAGQVGQLAARARTDLVGSVPRPGPRRPPRRASVTTGWAMWFGNRRVGLRDRWFRLRTSWHYRGCPAP